MYNVPRCFTFGNCEERSEFYPGKIPQHEWKRPAGNGSLCSALRRRGYYYSPQISTTGLGNNFSTFNHIQVRGSSHWMVFYWLAVGWRGGERGGKGEGSYNSIMVSWRDCVMADYFTLHNPDTVLEYTVEISPETEVLQFWLMIWDLIWKDPFQIPIKSFQYYKSLIFTPKKADLLPDRRWVLQEKICL